MYFTTQPVRSCSSSIVTIPSVPDEPHSATGNDQQRSEHRAKSWIPFMKSEREQQTDHPSDEEAWG
jgi:hypothetical protein